MANYTGQQKFLLRDAERYSDLGYRVGLAKGKTLIREYVPEDFSPWGDQEVFDFDGVSLIPEGIVCVDIDIPDFGVVYEELPPTFKERTPRGWHLWYRLPKSIHVGNSILLPIWSPKIKWRPHVDLLTKGPVKGGSRYKNTTGGPDHWGEHVLCAGTPGYKRIWPDETPQRDNLPLAPQWLQDVLLR